MHNYFGTSMPYPRKHTSMHTYTLHILSVCGYVCRHQHRDPPPATYSQAGKLLCTAYTVLLLLSSLLGGGRKHCQLLCVATLTLYISHMSSLPCCCAGASVTSECINLPAPGTAMHVLHNSIMRLQQLHPFWAPTVDSHDAISPSCTCQSAALRQALPLHAVMVHLLDSLTRVFHDLYWHCCGNLVKLHDFSLALLQSLLSTVC